MDVEESAIQIGHRAQERREVGVDVALTWLLREALVEQCEQKVLVESKELAFASLRLDLREPVTQIVHVPVEKSLPLDKVDEHQSVEHQGGIPLLVGLVGDALDESEEGGVLGLEAFVESLGESLTVEGVAEAVSRPGQVERLFLVERDVDVAELLDQGVAGLMVGMIRMLAVLGRLTRLTRNPLPDLSGLRFVDEDEEVFVGGLRDLLLDLPPRCMVGDAAIGAR